jgi:hypothetical protein
MSGLVTVKFKREPIMLHMAFTQLGSNTTCPMSFGSKVATKAE